MGFLFLSHNGHAIFFPNSIIFLLENHRWAKLLFSMWWKWSLYELKRNNFYWSNITFIIKRNEFILWKTFPFRFVRLFIFYWLLTNYFLGCFQNFLGASIAGVTFPYLADNYGRKKTLVWSVVFGSISVCLCGCVSSVYLFMLLIFIAGFV